jgi:hypothetical protein
MQSYRVLMYTIVPAAIALGVVFLTMRAIGGMNGGRQNHAGHGCKRDRR